MTDTVFKDFVGKFCESAEELQKKLEQAAMNPFLFQKIMDNLSKTVREDESVKFAVFFTCFSAYTKEPLNTFIRGPPSTGKSYGCVQTCQCFPEKDILNIGSGSPKFLIRQQGVLVDSSGEPFIMERPDRPRKSEYREAEDYREAVRSFKTEMKQYNDKVAETHTLIDLSGKTLVFLESPSLELFNMLRPILSHDKEEMNFPYVDKDSKGKIRTINVTVRGWPASIFLKAEDQYIEELATRSFTISPVESKNKYGAGNEVTNEFASFPWKKDEIEHYRKEVQTFIDYLKREIKDKQYILPFALNEAYPHDLPRDMRDFSHLLQLIQCVTLLHAKQRVILVHDEKEFIVSSFKDVEFAFCKFREIFETTRTGLSQHILSFYHKIVKEMPIDTESITVEGKRKPWRTGELVNKYNVIFSPRRSRRTILRYLELLEEIGYVSSGEDADDKRSSIWTALVQETKENCALNDFDQTLKDLKPKLEPSLKKWLEQLGHTNAQFYTEKINTEPQWLSWNQVEEILLCQETNQCHDLVKLETRLKTDLTVKASVVEGKTQDAQSSGEVE